MCRSWALVRGLSVGCGRGRLSCCGLRSRGIAAGLRVLFSGKGIRGEEHDDFFELLEICGGTNANLFVLSAGLDLGNDTDGQVLRKDAIHTAGNDARADADFVVVAD